MREPFITTSDLDRTRGMIDTFFEPAARLPNVICEASLASYACLLVAGGLGVAIVNELTACAARDVVLRPLTSPVWYDTNIMTGCRNPLTLAEQAFLKLVREMTPILIAAAHSKAPVDLSGSD